MRYAAKKVKLNFYNPFRDGMILRSIIQWLHKETENKKKRIHEAAPR